MRQGGIWKMNLKHFIVKNYNDLTQHSYVTKKMCKFRRGCMDTAAMQNTDAFRGREQYACMSQ